MFTIMNKKSNFSERINKLISYYDITANELARRVGGSRTKVYNAINGKASPGFETIEAILNSFSDVSAEWLVRGDGAMMKSDMVDKSEIETLLAENNAVKKMYREELMRNEPLKKNFNMGVSNHPQVDRSGASETLSKIIFANMKPNTKIILGGMWRFTSSN